jgi:hypothetical protein
VRSLIVMRSCSARVAMMEITTSRIIPQLSKNGSWKLRQPMPQSSSCCRWRNPDFVWSLCEHHRDQKGHHDEPKYYRNWRMHAYLLTYQRRYSPQSFARSPATVGLLSGSCSSARVFAPRFFQAPSHDECYFTFALRYHFTSITL